MPNPFPSSTTIHFETPAEVQVRIGVFDAAGRRVATLMEARVPGGTQSVRWEATDATGNAVRSGVYLCRLEAAGVSRTMRLLLLHR